MNKNLLILRNKTALLKSNSFFKENKLSFYSQEISFSKPIIYDIRLFEADIFIVTSQNALSVIENNIDFFKAKKIYALDSQVNDYLYKLGCHLTGCKNTKELAKHIIEKENSDSKVIHLCADNANKNFYKNFKNNDFNIESINVYKTDFVDNFDEKIVNALKSKEIKYIMIFSRSSIKAMEGIFKSYDLDINKYKIICFSEKIADGISDIFSKKSTLEDMLCIYNKLNRS